MRTVANIFEASPVRFGTSGLRGLVEELTDELCFAVTLGFLAHMRTRFEFEEVWLAHDLRPSSPRIAKAVVAAIRHSGLAPVFAGTVPTPALMLAATQANAASVMITGSHIPFDRNGLKFHSPKGEITKADEAPIIGSAVTVPDTIAPSDLPDPVGTAEHDYAERYMRAFPDLLKHMRVGLWQHSAVGRDLFEALLGDLGARVVPLGRSDDFVPVDTEAVADEDRERARAWAKEHELDALFSTDGDSDRPLLADGNGDFFRGDALGILTAHALKAEGVATPVSSNTALERSGWFGEVARTRIGSPHVLDAMTDLATRHERVVGFEANGGFMVETRLETEAATLAPLPTRDALLPALATIALAKREGGTLADLHRLLPARFTRSDRLENRPTQASSDFLDTIAHNRGEQDALLDGIGRVREVDETDGLRMRLDTDEIVHLRPSGNAPEFRIYVETADEARAVDLLADVKSRLAERLPEG